MLAMALVVVTGLSVVGCPENEGSPIGSNLTRFLDWTSEWVFVDCFKQSRPWTSGTQYVWDDGRELDLDEHGWVKSLLPGQVAKTLLFWYNGSAGKFPDGQYTVLYDGEGLLEYKGGAVYNEILSIPGRHIIDVNSYNGGIQLFLTATNPANYLRNIRIIMPGGVRVDDPYVWTDDNHPPDPENWSMFVDNYDTQLFHPAFLNTIRKYKALRFMNWMITNEPDGRGVSERQWWDRARVTDAQWTSRGIPVEVMCELSNRMHADPWFCVNHLSTDEYVEGFATIVRDLLDPDLIAYVEHSNEVWNPQYAQAQYSKDMGLSLGLSPDKFQAQMFYHSKRSVEIFRIWERVFGGAERFVRVLGSQAGNTWVSEQLLSYNDAYLECDALGVAPYWGGYLGHEEWETALESMTVDQLLVELETEALPRARDGMLAQKAVCDTYGVDLLAYEGGQHLVWGRGWQTNDTINALFHAVNRHPRIGKLYRQYLNDWFECGGGLYVNFLNCMNWGAYGRWGTLEYVTQPRATAPKYNAVMTFIEQWQSTKSEEDSAATDAAAAAGFQLKPLADPLG
jgi:hypothetical protein